MSGEEKETEKLLIEWFQLFTRVRNWIEIALSVNLPSDPIHFVEGLQDGIVLCYLSRTIEPRSIPRIQESKSTSFRLRENVTFFLAACKDFGILNTRLFTPPDLASKRVVRVVDTLAALAERVVKPAPEGVGFGLALPELKISVDMNFVKSQCSESTIQALSKQVIPLKPVARKGSARTSVLVARTQIKLMTGQGSFPQFEKGMTKLQAMWRGYQTRVMFQAMVRDQAFRENVAMEIKQTEKDYASQLETCITVFLEPLEKAAAENESTAPMTKDQIDAIFINIRDIFAFHKNFAKSLEERVGDEWTASKCIGDIFLELSSVTPAYSLFAQKYPQSIDVFDSVRSNKNCEAFLLECKGKSRLDLPSLLITPIQRIPRYNLLLNEYNKHTWEAHRDKPMLQKAIETVKSMANTINTTKSQVESERRLKQLFQTVKGIPDSIMKPGRVVVTEASFTDKHRDPVSLVLFKDALLWFKPGGIRKEPKFKDCLDLWCLELSHKNDDETSFEILRSGKCIMKLSSKESSVLIGFVRIWNDTKKSYEDSRAQARREESSILRVKKSTAEVPDASDVLVGRNNRGAQKNGKYYGKLSDAERNDVIQGLHFQRISIQQQLLTLEKSKVKASEREALKSSLSEQMDEIMARLAELGATPAHARTVQIAQPSCPKTNSAHSPSPSLTLKKAPSASSSSSSSPAESPETKELKKPEAAEKKGFGIHNLFRRDHARRMSDSAVHQRPKIDKETPPPQESDTAPSTSPPSRQTSEEKATPRGEGIKTPCTAVSHSTRPSSHSTSLVVNPAESSASGSVQDRIRQINAAARAASALSSAAKQNPSSTAAKK